MKPSLSRLFGHFPACKICNLSPSLFPSSLHPFSYVGELKTTARWIRDFVTAHPDYKQDSFVSDKVTYDLIAKIKEVAEGTISCPELAGPLDSA